MRLKDVPKANAYVVFHDAYMNGAMDVYPANDLATATEIAQRHQKALDETGQDECGIWRAYEKLPRVRVWKFHPTPVRVLDFKSRASGEREDEIA